MKKKLVFLVLNLAFAAQILAFNAEYSSFSSNFTQSIKSLNSTISYSGNFIITQNEAFWNYTSPSKKQIFINGKQVVVVEPDLQQATYSTLQDIPNLTQIFQKARKISPTQYEASYQGTKYTIRLENDEVKSIAYRDNLDNDVFITLSSQKRNQSVNKSRFTPKIPAGYDIIR